MNNVYCEVETVDGVNHPLEGGLLQTNNLY